MPYFVVCFGGGSCPPRRTHAYTHTHLSLSLSRPCPVAYLHLGHPFSLWACDALGLWRGGGWDQDKKGRTAIMYAAAQGWISIVDFLLGCHEVVSGEELAATGQSPKIINPGVSDNRFKASLPPALDEYNNTFSLAVVAATDEEWFHHPEYYKMLDDYIDSAPDGADRSVHQPRPVTKPFFFLCVLARESLAPQGVAPICHCPLGGRIRSHDHTLTILRGGLA